MRQCVILNLRAWTASVLIIAAAGIFCSARAQVAAWRSKPFQEWSRVDVEQVMNNSSWVAKQEVRIKQAPQISAAGGAPTSPLTQGGYLPSISNTVDVGSARPPVDFLFTLRLRSGLPIRAAMLRAKQLDANYDQMSEKERAAFDEKWNGILQCPACANNYVLTLTSSSQQQPGADPVYSVFKGARLADMQRYVYIANDKGERRALVHFVPPRVPGEEAIFYFARYDEKGAPLFNAKNKELLFNLTNVEVSLVANFRVNLSYLLIDGEISF